MNKPNRNLTSIVSYPERGTGGNNRYRGNCSPKLIEDLIGFFKPKGGKATAKGVEKTAKGTKTVTQKIADFCVSHKTVLLWVLALALLFMVVSGMFSACSTMFQGGTQVVLGTSFTAEDEDILGTDEDYTALENDLRSQVFLKTDLCGRNDSHAACFCHCACQG